MATLGRFFLVMMIGSGLCALPGCRLAGLRDPVPKALADSRKATKDAAELVEQGRPREAEKKLETAVKTCPTDADARRDYAKVLWDRQARAEALAHLEEACRLSPDDAAMRVSLAEKYLILGQIEPAWKASQQAIALDPKLPAAWSVRGRVLRAAGDLQRALADFHRALGYTPDDRQVLFETAEVYRQLGQAPEQVALRQRALQTLQQLAETYPPHEEPQQVLYLLGLAYGAVGRYDNAVESFATALVRDRPYPELVFRLAEAQWLAKRPQDAAVTLQQALALDPLHRPSRELLTQIEVAQRGTGGCMR